MLLHYYSVAKQVRRKFTVSVTLSPNLVHQIDDVVESGEFAGQSDVISQALSEFFARYYERKESKMMASQPVHGAMSMNESKEAKFPPRKVVLE